MNYPISNALVLWRGREKVTADERVVVRNGGIYSRSSSSIQWALPASSWKLACRPLFLPTLIQFTTYRHCEFNWFKNTKPSLLGRRWPEKEVESVSRYSFLASSKETFFQGDSHNGRKFALAITSQPGRSMISFSLLRLDVSISEQLDWDIDTFQRLVAIKGEVKNRWINWVSEWVSEWRQSS